MIYQNYNKPFSNSKKKTKILLQAGLLLSGPVHMYTNPFSKENGAVLLRIRL